jgi:hypothetical protein
MKWKKVGEVKHNHMHLALAKNDVEFDDEYWEKIIWKEVDMRIKMRDYPWLYPRKNNVKK